MLSKEMLTREAGLIYLDITEVTGYQSHDETPRFVWMVWAQTPCREGSRFDASGPRPKPGDGKNKPESHRTTEGFRAGSSSPANRTKIYCKSGAAILKETDRKLESDHECSAPRRHHRHGFLIG